MAFINHRLTAANQPGWLSLEPADPIVAARVRAEQFSTVVRYTPWLMLANCCNALVLLVSFLGSASFPKAALWTATVIAVAAYIYFMRRRHAVSRREGRRSTAHGRAIANGLALGAAWAALPLFFFEGAGHGAQLLIVCLSAGMLCGGVFALASLPHAALAFSGPIAAASFLTLTHSGEKHHLLIAVVLVVYAAVLLRGSFAHAEEIKRRVLAQAESEDKARLRLHKLQTSGLSAIGGMASSLAHEVNQPLTAAANYLHTSQALLRRQGEPPASESMEALEKARCEVARACEIISHLRDFFISGEPDMRFLRLHPLIAEVCQQVSATAQKAGVHIRLQLECERDTVLADRVQIGQVLANLIRNAIDAVRGRSKREVMITTRETGDGLMRVDISDTGPGVSQAIAPELFAPFMTTKNDGMGVGLALSRSIVEAHYGKIWAEPCPGGGARFSFALPFAPQEGDVAWPDHPPPAHA
jgi:C4-dicarboxylate-specific signal transduction histidine kinase